MYHKKTNCVENIFINAERCKNVVHIHTYNIQQQIIVIWYDYARIKFWFHPQRVFLRPVRVWEYLGKGLALETLWVMSPSVFPFLFQCKFEIWVRELEKIWNNEYLKPSIEHSSSNPAGLPNVFDWKVKESGALFNTFFKSRFMEKLTIINYY